jgi:hypothetical protein
MGEGPRGPRWQRLPAGIRAIIEKALSLAYQDDAVLLRDMEREQVQARMTWADLLERATSADGAGKDIEVLAPLSRAEPLIEQLAREDPQRERALERCAELRERAETRRGVASTRKLTTARGLIGREPGFAAERLERLYAEASKLDPRPRRWLWLAEVAQQNSAVYKAYRADLEAAIVALDRDDPSTARTNFAVVEAPPDLAPLIYLKDETEAMLQAKNGYLAEALKNLEKLQHLFGTYPDLRERKEDLEREQQTRKAREDAERRTQTLWEDAKEFVKRSNQQVEQKKWEEAVRLREMAFHSVNVLLREGCTPDREKDARKVRERIGRRLEELRKHLPPPPGPATPPPPDPPDTAPSSPPVHAPVSGKVGEEQGRAALLDKLMGETPGPGQLTRASQTNPAPEVPAPPLPLPPTAGGNHAPSFRPPDKKGRPVDGKDKIPPKKSVNLQRDVTIAIVVVMVGLLFMGVVSMFFISSIARSPMPTPSPSHLSSSASPYLPSVAASVTETTVHPTATALPRPTPSPCPTPTPTPSIQEVSPERVFFHKLVETLLTIEISGLSRNPGIELHTTQDYTNGKEQGILTFGISERLDARNEVRGTLRFVNSAYRDTLQKQLVGRMEAALSQDIELQFFLDGSPTKSFLRVAAARARIKELTEEQKKTYPEEDFVRKSSREGFHLWQDSNRKTPVMAEIGGREVPVTLWANDRVAILKEENEHFYVHIVESHVSIGEDSESLTDFRGSEGWIGTLYIENIE